MWPLSCELGLGLFSFMHLFKHIVFFLLIVSSVSSAQSVYPEPDSTSSEGPDRSYALPEFVTSATRWRVAAQQLPSSATVLTSVDLASRNGSSLASALEGVPGLYLKSYGGPGAVSTTSLRGMGAEHTLVLVDGQRYNNVRDGQVDFGIFQLQNVERVEVLRGGYSSVYGADALGGIINVVTRRLGSRSRLSGELTGGSYGRNGQAVNAEFSLGIIGLRVAAKRDAGTGNYEFNFNDGITSSVLRRQNADFSESQVQFLLDVPLSSSLSLTLQNCFDWSDRGSPGAVLSEASSNRARLRDGGFRTQASINWALEPTLTLRLATQFNAQRRQYFDPSSAGSPDDQQSEFADKTITLTSTLQYVMSSTTVSVGAEFSHSSITGKQINGVDREQRSAFISADHIIELPGEMFYQINVYPSLRIDQFSDVASSVDPRFGVNIGIWRSAGLRLKSSFGRSFHAPTFYDLYWKVGGNPLLKPERSLSFDAGLGMSMELLGPLEIEGSYFNIRTVDRIVWMPDNGGIWSPKNLQSVRSDGIELMATWRIMQQHLVIRGSYTTSESKKMSADMPGDQTADKQLPFIPREMASLSVSFNWGLMCVNVNHVFTGYRFSTESNDPYYVLPGYNKTDANVSLRVTNQPFVSTLRLEVTNLFNSSYQVFPNFPMPLRALAVKLLLEY